MNGYVEEVYGGYIVIKVFNVEKKSIEKFNNFNNKLYEVVWKL